MSQTLPLREYFPKATACTLGTYIFATYFVLPVIPWAIFDRQPLGYLSYLQILKTDKPYTIINYTIGCLTVSYLGAWISTSVRRLDVHGTPTTVQKFATVMVFPIGVLYTIYSRFREQQWLYNVSLGALVLFHLVLVYLLFQKNINCWAVFHADLTSFGLIVNAVSNVDKAWMHIIGARVAYVGSLLLINSLGNQRCALIFGFVGAIVLLATEAMVAHSVFITPYFGSVLVSNVLGLVFGGCAIGSSIQGMH